MRDRSFRRAQTERYKAKQKRDIQSHQNTSWAIKYDPAKVSDTRHHLDCGKRCFMCHGEKLIFGRRRERYGAKLAIRKGDDADS